MNKPVAWNEEEFNAIAYSYRSWPMHDPKGVSVRYEELVNYVQSITHPVKELTDEEMYRLLADAIWAVGLNTDCLDEQNWTDGITVAKAILRKAQEK